LEHYEDYDGGRREDIIVFEREIIKIMLKLGINFDG
jgi:hypothetical protein